MLVLNAGEIVTIHRSASSDTTYDPLDIAVALNFTTRAAAGSALPPPSSASAPTSAVSGNSRLESPFQTQQGLFMLCNEFALVPVSHVVWLMNL